MINRAARTSRLAQEIRGLSETPPWGISCSTKEAGVYDILMVQMRGPEGSPYERGTFGLVIDVPEKYPFEPPHVKFVTRIRHPNIDRVGRICMDMLKMPPSGTWLPTITMETLLVSIQALMTNPNPDDPLDAEYAYEYKNNHEQFVENARRDTEKYAMTYSMDYF